MLTIHVEDDEDDDEDDSKLNSPQKKKSAINKKYKDSGVKKCIILCIAEAVPEKYENIKIMLDLLNIGYLKIRIIAGKAGIVTLSQKD